MGTLRVFHDIEGKRYFVKGFKDFEFTAKGFDRVVFLPKALKKFATADKATRHLP